MQLLSEGGYYFFLVFVQLLSEGGYHSMVAFISLESLRISRTAELRSVWAMHLGLIDAGSSTRSFLVLLSGMETLCVRVCMHAYKSRRV